ncbi:unnamed protein product [marine sediment metagenome]|uniref:Uncharacterized protein n=1 Tax=marine sediment metagenome TaxID=412755 RepID=X1HV24_9ZZZZ
MKYKPPLVIEIEGEIDFHTCYNPPAFLYIGRVLAEGKPELLRGKTYYGHIHDLGEFVHETELGEEVKEERDESGN